MEAKPLPLRPSLEQYKKHAKDLLRVSKSGNRDTIRAWAEQWFEGCADLWVQTEARQRDIEVTGGLRDLVRREVVDRTEKSIQASKLSGLTDAQFYIARGHGFESWPRFAAQIQALQSAHSPDAKFEAAADAIVAGDLPLLQRLLAENPQLITARSQRTHHGTLLHYVAANGIEDFRQKTPGNIVEIAKLLLDAGADVNAACDAYGGGSVVLLLAATSVHPERAGVQEPLLQLLLDYGARMEGPEGKPYALISGCLANGRGKAATFFAARGAPLDLETAAGAGRLDLVTGYFDDDGTLKSNATIQELQRGFLWACEYGHRDIVEFLLPRGADLRNQAGTSETALHWAVIAGDVAMIKLLLDRGAPLEELNGYGGTSLGQAGWSFINGDPRLDYAPVFEVLLAAGAYIEDGWLAWLDRQEGRSAEKKAAIADLLRRYGASV
jgi:Ankyrin repeats (3 copies)/Ankyrin repeat